MTVLYHPAVQRDVSKILRHYDGINHRLGDEFWQELNSFEPPGADGLRGAARSWHAAGVLETIQQKCSAVADACRKFGVRRLKTR